MPPTLRRLTIRSARVWFLSFFALVGFAVLPADDIRDAAITAQPAAPAADGPAAMGNIVRQGFPAGKTDSSDLKKSDTAWEIEWDLTHPENRPMTPPGSVLRIRSAKFMWKNKSGQPQWVTVARMLELAEIYVPYDNGFVAFLDVHHHPFFITPARKEFLGPNCVAPGEILKSPNPAWTQTVHKEVHDDGIRWMSAEADALNLIADRARRGEKLILWSTYYGANYRYLIEYNFGDDGTITCRLGFTGRNIFNRQEDLQDTHLHVGCWRMEFDLGDPASNVGGPKENEILLVRRIFDENAERFGQVARPFAKNTLGQACEGSARWRATEFTSLRVQSKVRKNAHGRPISFDLIPHRVGAVEQLPAVMYSGASNMDFINYDFWVTRTESGFTDYVDVPQYASQKRPLAGYPTTLWHSAPALHVPRGEDFGDENGTITYTGAAITGWASFSVRPRDLFDSTPLYRSRQQPPRFFRRVIE